MTTETIQVTLLDFNVLAEEIKTLTQNILKNRWEIAEKLFYIRNNWDEYKKQPDFLYKYFKDFIEDYYGWTRKEADYYIDAQKLKLLLLEDKRKPASFYTDKIDKIDITTADKLYDLAQENETEVFNIIEEKPDITRKEVEDTIKKVKREKKSDEGKKIKLKTKELDLRLGDFKTVLNDVPDGSIDLILTDPPYPIEFIDCWESLGKIAKKKLKKNGFLIAYSGHKNIYEVMTRLNTHLDYYWMFALIHTGITKILAFNNIAARWKPILIYQNGYKKIDHKIDDVIQGSGRSKKNHEWEQSVDELDYFIDNFSEKGDVVLDPMSGSGSTLLGCLKKKRKCIGVEIDEKTFNILKKRLSDEGY